jgi:hypothetical protein
MTLTIFRISECEEQKSIWRGATIPSKPLHLAGAVRSMLKGLSRAEWIWTFQRREAKVIFGVGGRK